MQLKSIVESLVFAADKPLTLRNLRQLTGGKSEEIKGLLEDIQGEFEQSGIHLVNVGGGYQFRTNPANASWVKKFLAGKPARLTRPMLETLAIIAYRQPATRPEIEEVRGVDCGSTLRVLLERNLIRIVGKREEAGRPLLYGTSQYFLEFFNLKSLSSLPTLKEFAELSENHAQQVDEIYGEAPEEEPIIPLADQVVYSVTEVDAEEERAMGALDTAISQATDVLKEMDPKKKAKQEEAAQASEVEAVQPSEEKAADEAQPSEEEERAAVADAGENA
jgi:segregation and condensation protein B